MIYDEINAKAYKNNERLICQMCGRADYQEKMIHYEGHSAVCKRCVDKMNKLTGEDVTEKILNTAKKMPLEEIKAKMCDLFCKWPGECDNETELAEICDKCPLNNLED